MTALLSVFFMVAGAVLCLLAAVGVLRLPDFFMRMHAATKAGVAGCGLLLIGVAFAEPSPGMWIKVAIATAFLLLTTPVAGHLLARAGYVGGVPLWTGTRKDQLQGELRRGNFDRLPRPEPLHAAADQDVPHATQGSEATFGNEPQATQRDDAPGSLQAIVVTLANGPHAGATIDQAMALARRHRIPLVGLAVVDTRMLHATGSLPLRGISHAANLKRNLVEKARRSLADTVQSFEQRAQTAGIPFSLFMEEGDPVKILRANRRPRTLMLIGRDSWFDQGAGEGRARPVEYLARQGIYPLISVAKSPATVETVTFIHDGTPHSDRTLQWFLSANPWPEAKLRLLADPAVRSEEIGAAQNTAAAIMEMENERGDVFTTTSSRPDVLIFGNDGHAGWINSARAMSRPDYSDIPIVVFG